MKVTVPILSRTNGCAGYDDYGSMAQGECLCEAGINALWTSGREQGELNHFHLCLVLKACL